MLNLRNCVHLPAPGRWVISARAFLTMASHLWTVVEMAWTLKCHGCSYEDDLETEPTATATVNHSKTTDCVSQNSNTICGSLCLNLPHRWHHQRQWCLSAHKAVLAHHNAKCAAFNVVIVVLVLWFFTHPWPLTFRPQNCSSSYSWRR